MNPKQALANRIEPLCQRVDNVLSTSLDSAPHPDGHPARLLDAMRYSLFNGGKRIRPVLVYAACEALGGDLNHADQAAAAVECIHAYSLIHDDLPAMDDDELRRGKPTCHIAFDEATAILAGDALQSLAFELLANDPTLAAENRLAMLLGLSRASGASGMVAGQALDMDAEQRTLTLAQLERVHNLKTGALINAAVELGARASGNADPQTLAALAQYSNAIGLAFQVQDDILDIESDTETLGKTQGADLARSKSTYPALLGLEGAHAMAQKLHQLALDALQPLPQNTELLRLIANYIISRDH
ncbi:(2E,6E)-farnesyl diphosphate synthase [Motiliproteus sp.]|uniref:(2E,6E)-farnesyl diphosphate synthase n=1 Tax=Motiliproteus sp. TaxID=1898955 RepID=UPI003BA99EAB